MDANRNVVEFAELTSIGLTPKKVARIENGRGTRLRVETGAVWITEHCSNHDVFLKAGESYCIEHDGMTLISALKTPFALVNIEPPMPVTRARSERFWNFWAGLYVPQSRPTTAAL